MDLFANYGVRKFLARFRVSDYPVSIYGLGITVATSFLLSTVKQPWWVRQRRDSKIKSLREGATSGNVLSPPDMSCWLAISGQGQVLRIPFNR
jgi:hypothetical protein